MLKSNIFFYKLIKLRELKKNYIFFTNNYNYWLFDLNTDFILNNIKNNFNETPIKTYKHTLPIITPKIVIDKKNIFLEKKITILISIYFDLDFCGKFRHKLIKSIFHIIFFENTSTFKSFFNFWIKFLPLKFHKKLSISLLTSFKLISTLLQLFNLQFKLFIKIKGKFNVRGDNRSKKLKYILLSKHKQLQNTNLFYDGTGSPAKFGLSFLKIVYTHAYFKNPLKH